MYRNTFNALGSICDRLGTVFGQVAQGLGAAVLVGLAATSKATEQLADSRMSLRRDALRDAHRHLSQAEFWSHWDELRRDQLLMELSRLADYSENGGYIGDLSDLARRIGALEPSASWLQRDRVRMARLVLEAAK